MPASSPEHTHSWRPVRFPDTEWCWICTRYRHKEPDGSTREPDGWRIYDTLPKLKRALMKEGTR